MSDVPRDKLAKLLRMLTSSHEGEVLAAANRINAIVKDSFSLSSLQWCVSMSTVRTEKMALPITRGESSPIFRYNAKAGRCSIDDQSLTSITMIVDMDNAEVGWVFFGEGAAPDFQMVRIADLEAGADFPAKPDARDGQGRPTYKRGFRCMVKVPDKLANGSSVREWASNSRATCDGFDKIHDLWLAGRDNNPGRLPMVKMTGVEEVKGQHGSNYVPLFTIRDWIDRPADMTAKPNGATKPPMSGAKSVIIADEDGDDNDVEFS